MNKKVYKLTEEQYNRISEGASLYSNNNENGSETVVKTTKSDLSNATSKALNTNASAIEITDGGSSVNESEITKKELIAEARKEWKNGTKVVKMCDLLKN